MRRAHVVAVLVAAVVAGLVLSSLALPAAVAARSAQPALQSASSDLDLAGLAIYPLDTGDDAYKVVRGVGCLTPAACADPMFFSAETEDSLTKAGLKQAYALALVKPGSGANSSAARILATTLAEYSDTAGAKSGLTTFMSWLSDPAWQIDVSGKIGSDPELFDSQGPLPSDASATDAVGLRFRVGKLVVGIEIRDYSGKTISHNEIESLAQSLIDRVNEKSGPDLAQIVVHHRPTSTEYYVHLDSTTIPLAQESDDQFAARSSEFANGHVEDVLQSSQVLVAGDDPTTPDVSMVITIYRLPSKEEAQAYLLSASNSFAAGRARVGGVTQPPADPPAVGDTSVWYLNIYSDAYQAMGFIQVGDTVARVIWQKNQTVNAGEEKDLLERAETDLLPGAEYTAKAEVTCIQDNGCPGVTRLPSRLLPKS